MATVTSKSRGAYGHGLVQIRSSGTTTIAVKAGSTYDYFFHELRFNLTTGAAIGSTFTATINSSQGTVHDLELVNQNMTGVRDLHYQPTRPIPLTAGETVDVSWTCASTNKWGLQVIISQG